MTVVMFLAKFVQIDNKSKGVIGVVTWFVSYWVVQLFIKDNTKFIRQVREELIRRGRVHIQKYGNPKESYALEDFIIDEIYSFLSKQTSQAEHNLRNAIVILCNATYRETLQMPLGSSHRNVVSDTPTREIAVKNIQDYKQVNPDFIISYTQEQVLYTALEDFLRIPSSVKAVELQQLVFNILKNSVKQSN